MSGRDWVLSQSWLGTRSPTVITKVKEVQKKFETLVKTVQSREVFFNEVTSTLEVFTHQVEGFEVSYIETIDFLESRELLQVDVGDSAKHIDDLVRKKDQMKPNFDEMVTNGKGLINKKDVTDKGLPSSL